MGRLTRYLKPPQIKLELETRAPDAWPDVWSAERRTWDLKERLLSELVALLDTSGRIVNATKLHTDLVNRERKSVTALGGGIAIPHVRTMQARDFTLAFGRSTEGIDFGAPDGEPVHFFIAVVAPPYEDKLYLDVYKSIGGLFTDPDVRGRLEEADSPHEVIKVISDFEP